MLRRLGDAVRDSLLSFKKLVSEMSAKTSIQNLPSGLALRLFVSSDMILVDFFEKLGVEMNVDLLDSPESLPSKLSGNRVNKEFTLTAQRNITKRDKRTSTALYGLSLAIQSDR